MKSALIQGFKAFVSQVRQNVFEVAKTTCEKNGYEVNKKPVKPTKKEA